jgi:putative hydrolase of the HAD superfamily
MGAFAGFRALSFDCYGTLIDWETGIADELVPWAERRGVAVTREELLGDFGRHESAVEREQPTLPYPAVLATTLERIADAHGAEATGEERAAFGASVGRWPAFPDSPAALGRLGERFRLVILSNVDRASFAASNERLGVTFDLVLTAEDIGSYKPSRRNFEALLEALPAIGVERTELLHVAQSLYHDHEPAGALGLPSVWIDRRHDRPGVGATPVAGDDVSPRWRFTSLAAFADAALLDS